MPPRRSLIIAVISLLCALSARADPPRRIPMEDFFKDPQYSSARISPDGKHLAFLAPDHDRMSVWVCAAGAPFASARLAVHDAERGIWDFRWTRDSRFLLYDQDTAGDENTHIFRADPFAPEKPAVDLTPVKGTKARILHLPHDLPGAAWILWNRNDPHYFDLGALDLTSGDYKMVLPRPYRPENIVFEDSGNALAVLHYTYNKRVDLQVLDRGEGAHRPPSPLFPVPSPFATPFPKASPPSLPTPAQARDPHGANWRTIATYDALDSVSLWGFNSNRSLLYLSSDRGSNTEQLRALDIATGTETLIDEDPEYDLSTVFMSERTHRLLGVACEKERYEIKALAPDFQRDMDTLSATLRGSIHLAGMTDDEEKWIVYTRSSTDRSSVYLYDRPSGEVKFLYRPYPWLNPEEMAEMKPITFETRDGWKLHGYLTLPRGAEPRGLPTVLMIHGGPQERDAWGYDATVQFLANRGFAVLQVNFRGSTGYGKKFCSAGDREWGGKMVDDLVDGVDWLVNNGVADQKRIGIFGASYGGFAALSALAFHPGVFACGVDLSGPSNLITFAQNAPPYWAGSRDTLTRMIGDPEKDAAFMRSCSPFFSADKIREPLFIAQGENDPRVRRSESDQMVQALREHGAPVEYLLFPGEGHSLEKIDNRLQFIAKMEAFLEKHLK